MGQLESRSVIVSGYLSFEALLPLRHFTLGRSLIYGALYPLGHFSLCGFCPSDHFTLQNAFIFGVMCLLGHSSLWTTLPICGLSAHRKVCFFTFGALCHVFHSSFHIETSKIISGVYISILRKKIKDCFHNDFCFVTPKSFS